MQRGYKPGVSQQLLRGTRCHVLVGLLASGPDRARFVGGTKGRFRSSGAFEVTKLCYPCNDGSGQPPLSLSVEENRRPSCALP